MRILKFVLVFMVCATVLMAQTTTVFDDTYLASSTLSNAVTAESGLDISTTTYLPNDSGEVVGPYETAGWYGDPAEDPKNYDWGWVTPEFNLAPRTASPYTSDTTNDWIRWTARWGYKEVADDPVTVKVQVIWDAYYTPVRPSGPVIHKYKTIIMKTYPGKSVVSGTSYYGVNQTVYIRFNGSAAFQANKPSGAGYGWYCYRVKMHLIRKSYGVKSVETKSSNATQSRSYGG